jgi:hypothetical protein
MFWGCNFGKEKHRTTQQLIGLLVKHCQYLQQSFSVVQSPFPSSQSFLYGPVCMVLLKTLKFKDPPKVLIFNKYYFADPKRYNVFLLSFKNSFQFQVLG